MKDDQIEKIVKQLEHTLEQSKNRWPEHFNKEKHNESNQTASPHRRPVHQR